MRTSSPVGCSPRACWLQVWIKNMAFDYLGPVILQHRWLEMEGASLIGTLCKVWGEDALFQLTYIVTTLMEQAEQRPSVTAAAESFALGVAHLLPAIRLLSAIHPYSPTPTRVTALPHTCQHVEYFPVTFSSPEHLQSVCQAVSSLWSTVDMNFSSPHRPRTFQTTHASSIISTAVPLNTPSKRASCVAAMRQTHCDRPSEL